MLQNAFRKFSRQGYACRLMIGACWINMNVKRQPRGDSQMHFARQSPAQIPVFRQASMYPRPNIPCVAMIRCGALSLFPGLPVVCSYLPGVASCWNWWGPLVSFYIFHATHRVAGRVGEYLWFVAGRGEDPILEVILPSGKVGKDSLWPLSF